MRLNEALKLAKEKVGEKLFKQIDMKSFKRLSTKQAAQYWKELPLMD